MSYEILLLQTRQFRQEKEIDDRANPFISKEDVAKFLDFIESCATDELNQPKREKKSKYAAGNEPFQQLQPIKRVDRLNSEQLARLKNRGQLKMKKSSEQQMSSNPNTFSNTLKRKYFVLRKEEKKFSELVETIKQSDGRGGRRLKEAEKKLEKVRKEELELLERIAQKK